MFKVGQGISLRSAKQPTKSVDKPNPLNSVTSKLVHFSPCIFFEKLISRHWVELHFIRHSFIASLAFERRDDKRKCYHDVCCSLGYNFLVIWNSLNGKSIDLYVVNLFVSNTIHAVCNAVEIAPLESLVAAHKQTSIKNLVLLKW